MYEPTPQPDPGPCSTPHSAPVAWMRYDPGIEPPTSQAEDGGPQPREREQSEADALTPQDQRRRDIDAFLSAYKRIAPERERRDGWTPFLRRLFLQVIAEGGGVSAACAYTKMSRSSAYALEARDRVFAAGWAAASYFARNPMADDFYEKARDGIIDTITRGDGVTVTRRRFDSRLSIAVLNRLDRRCDRAEERCSTHLAAVRNWDEYLTLVGNGDDKAAEALLDRSALSAVEGSGVERSGVEGVRDRQHCQLPERAFPIPPPDPPGCEPSEYCWRAGSDADLRPNRAHPLPDGTWITTFPPPPGFDGYENCPFDGVAWYERACTPEEAELLDASEAAGAAEEEAEDIAFAEAERDSFFGKLRAELACRVAQPGSA